MKVKFVSFQLGQYHTPEKRLQHAVYALSEDGEIYKYERAKGWVRLSKNRDNDNDEDAEDNGAF